MAKTKVAKMFPTKEQNQKTAQKAVNKHKEILSSGRNVTGQKTGQLSEAYRKRKQKIRPGSPNYSDFKLSGKLLESFRVDNRETTSSSIAYRTGSYFKKNKQENLRRGLSSRFSSSDLNRFAYVNPGTPMPIPPDVYEILVNDFANNTKGNISEVLKKKKPFTIEVNI